MGCPSRSHCWLTWWGMGCQSPGASVSVLATVASPLMVGVLVAVGAAPAIGAIRT